MTTAGDDRTLPFDAVEHHLRRLDAAELTAFVADLWDAKGVEVDRDPGRDGVVSATRDGASRTIRVVPAGRIDRLPGPVGRLPGAGSAADSVERRRSTHESPSRRAASGSTRAPASKGDGAVDVVVAPGGERTVPAAITRTGARVVDAGALREQLRYAVDRPTARELCTRHLGAPPEELRRPPGRRLCGRLRGTASEVTARSTDGPAASVRPVLTVVAVVVLIAAVGLCGVVGPGFASDLGGPTSAAGVDAGGPDGSAGDPTRVPGVTTAGVENLTALAAAHDRALAGRSYTLRLDVTRPRDGDPTATRVRRATEVTVAGARSLAVTTSRVRGERRTVGAIYHDGTDWFVAESTDWTASYRRLPSTTVPPSIGPAPVGAVTPSALRSTLVSRYLSTPESTLVERTRLSRWVHYRVVGHGTPSGLDRAGVRNYSVVAIVTGDGLVRDASVAYTVATETGEYRVRVDWTYGERGSTVVETPGWYERRFLAGGLGDGDTDASTGEGASGNSTGGDVTQNSTGEAAANASGLDGTGDRSVAESIESAVTTPYTGSRSAQQSPQGSSRWGSAPRSARTPAW